MNWPVICLVKPNFLPTLSCLKDADQYKYGKNRVEADAKRLQAKEEELLKRREGLRDRLAQLRKERKGLRAAIEVNTGTRGPFCGASASAQGLPLTRLSSFHAVLLAVRKPCWKPGAGATVWSKDQTGRGPLAGARVGAGSCPSLGC